MARVDTAFLVALVLGSGCGAPLPEGTVVGDAGPADGSSGSGGGNGGTAAATSASASASGADTGSDPSATGSQPDPTGAPATTGTPTSGGEASGAASVGSTGVPANCGDGIVDGDEDCDDMNGDELDGCTSACAAGPTDLVFGTVSTTDDFGGDGGNYDFDGNTDCPAGQVLLGLAGGIVPQEHWIGTVRGRCGAIELGNADPPAIVTGPGADLDEHGGYGGGGPWELMCPVGQLLVGAEGRSGSVMDQLTIHCAVPTMVPGGSGQLEIQLDPGDEIGPAGNDGGGPEGPVVCNDGEIATGVHLSTNSYLIRMALRCRAIDLAY